MMIEGKCCGLDGSRMSDRGAFFIHFFRSERRARWEIRESE